MGFRRSVPRSHAFRRLSVMALCSRIDYLSPAALSPSLTSHDFPTSRELETLIPPPKVYLLLCHSVIPLHECQIRLGSRELAVEISHPETVECHRD